MGKTSLFIKQLVNVCLGIIIIIGTEGLIQNALDMLL